MKKKKGRQKQHKYDGGLVSVVGGQVFGGWRTKIKSRTTSEREDARNKIKVRRSNE